MPHVFTPESDRDKFRELAAVLSQRPVDPYVVTMMGCVHNVLRGVTRCLLEVDAWPAFTKALLYQTSSHAARALLLADDRAGLAEFIDANSIIDWDAPFMPFVVPVELVPLWHAAAARRGWDVDGAAGAVHYCYPSHRVYTPSRQHLKRLPAGFTVAEIRPEHADLVNSTWLHNEGAVTAAAIRHHTRHLPSVCVYDRQGRPVSWINVLDVGCSGIGYTLPEYRKQGLYDIVYAETVFRRHQMNFPNYGYIVTGNTAAERASQLGCLTEKCPHQIVFLRYTKKVDTSKL